TNFAEAKELYVTAALMPLLHSDVQIKSVELRQPKIELIRNAEGVWNFSSLAETAPKTQAQPQQAPQPQPANKPSAATPEPQKQKAISLEDLKITDGQVEAPAAAAPAFWVRSPRVTKNSKRLPH